MSALDIGTVTNQQTMTNAEIYTRSMMCSNDGLPCWRPEPREPTGEAGIIPGDVGTFDLMNGFRKIFNVWEDGFAAQYQLLPQASTIHADHFGKGEAIVEGISSEPCWSEDRR